MLPPYDLLNTTHWQTQKNQPTNVLAAIRDCINTLSKDELLLAKETELHTHFAHVFEPPPHVDKLPTTPLAQIRLKDPNKVIKT